MKRLFALLIVASAAFSPAIARADLIGSTVDGTLLFTGSSTNFFSPASVVVGPGIEFSATDSNILYTFDFTETTLVVTNSTKTPTTEIGFVATFTDPEITELTVLSNTIAGMTFTQSGDVLTVDFAGHQGTPVQGDLGTAVAQVSTPEPSTFALLGTGLLGVAGTVRRKLA